MSVYMVLQPARRTADEHYCRRGGLLPHLFTLTCRPEGRHRRLFSVTLLHPHERRAVNSCGALCCSDFPLPLRAAIERTCNFSMISPLLLLTDVIPIFLGIPSNSDLRLIKAHQPSRSGLYLRPHPLRKLYNGGYFKACEVRETAVY